MNELNHQEEYKVGAKFEHVSKSALNPNEIFTIGKCVDPETEFIPNTERKKEDEVFGIALLNSKGTNYSHIIYKGVPDSVETISKDEFRKITANTHLDFKYIG
jgi:hypothetical protein